jgi:plastocyanin
MTVHGMNIRTSVVPLSALVIVMILSLMAVGCTSPQTSNTPPATFSGTENPIVIKNFAFSPSAITVKAGSSVTWINQDGTDHTVVSDTGSPVAFASQNLPNGGSFSVTFSKPGTYTYHCSIHPSMTGTITVT